LTILVIAITWLLVLSVLILAVINGMALKACRQQSASLKHTLSRWLATPTVWILGILAAVLLGLALWVQTQTGLGINVVAIQGAHGLGRASLLLGTIVLVLGAAGFFFNDPAPDR
jgi:hypothetical protein